MNHSSYYGEKTEQEKYLVEIEGYEGRERAPFFRSNDLDSVKFTVASWLESIYYLNKTKVFAEDIIYDKIQAIVYHPNVPLNKVKFHVEERGTKCQ